MSNQHDAGAGRSPFAGRRSPRLARSPGNVLTPMSGPKENAYSGYSTGESFYTPEQPAEDAENQAPNSLVFSSGRKAFKPAKSPLRRNTMSPAALPPMSPAAPRSNASKKRQQRRRTASPGAMASLLAEMQDEAMSPASPASPPSPEEDSIAARVRARSPSPARQPKKQSRRRTASPGALDALLAEASVDEGSPAAPAPAPAPAPVAAPEEDHTVSPGALNALAESPEPEPQPQSQSVQRRNKGRRRTASPGALDALMAELNDSGEVAASPEPAPIAARTRARSPSPMRAAAADRPSQRRRTASPGALTALMAELDEPSPATAAHANATAPKAASESRRTTASPGGLLSLMQQLEHTEELDVPAEALKQQQQQRRSTVSPQTFAAAVADLDESTEQQQQQQQQPRRTTASPSALQALMTDSDAEAEAEVEEPATPAQATELKSCLSGKGRSAPRSVVFGSPNVAEFNKHSPTTSMTPMERHTAKLLFPLDQQAQAQAEEEDDDDENTSRNSNILDDWDSIASAGSEPGSSGRRRRESIGGTPEPPASDVSEQRVLSFDEAASDEGGDAPAAAYQEGDSELFAYSASEDGDSGMLGMAEAEAEDRTVELEGNLGALLAKLDSTPVAKEALSDSRLLMSASRAAEDVSADIEHHDAAFAVMQRVQRLKEEQARRDSLSPSAALLASTPAPAGPAFAPGSSLQLPTPQLSPVHHDEDEAHDHHDVSASMADSSMEQSMVTDEETEAALEKLLAAVANEDVDEMSIWGAHQSDPSTLDLGGELGERIWRSMVVVPRLVNVSNALAAITPQLARAEAVLQSNSSENFAHDPAHVASAMRSAAVVRQCTRAHGWDTWDLQLSGELGVQLKEQQKKLKHVLEQFGLAGKRLERVAGAARDYARDHANKTRDADQEHKKQLAAKDAELKAATEAAGKEDDEVFSLDAELEYARERRANLEARIAEHEREAAACNAEAEARQAELAARRVEAAQVSLADASTDAVAGVCDLEDALSAQRSLMLWAPTSLEMPQLAFEMRHPDGTTTAVRATVAADGAALESFSLELEPAAEGSMLAQLWAAAAANSDADHPQQLSQLPAALQALETRFGRLHELAAELDRADKRHDVRVLPVAGGAVCVEVQATGASSLCVSTLAVPVHGYPYEAPSLSGFEAKWGPAATEQAAREKIEHLRPGFGMLRGAVEALTSL